MNIEEYILKKILSNMMNAKVMKKNINSMVIDISIFYYQYCYIY